MNPESDLSLAPTIKPLVQALGGRVETAMQALAAAGFSAVQLDATLPGCRPRELDQRARKGLTLAATRRGLVLGGIDLFIPQSHFIDPAHIDKAMNATTAAIDMANDLGGLTLTLALPVADMVGEALDELIDRADTRRVTLAVQVVGDDDPTAAWIKKTDLPWVGASLDPAACFGTGEDPIQITHHLGPRLRSARLSDATDTSGVSSAERCMVGDGVLDLLSYRIAVDMSPKRTGPVVLDLRGEASAPAHAVRAKQAWDLTAPPSA